jgi:hypothetical protein
MSEEFVRKEIREEPPVPQNPMRKTSNEGIQFIGKAPPAFQKAFKEVQAHKAEVAEEDRIVQAGKRLAEEAPLKELGKAFKEGQIKQPQMRAMGSSNLEEVIDKIRPHSYVFDEVTLPSKGVFYNGSDGPTDGILHLRPMTGEEEQILATPRFIKRGVAINMIFQRCLKENFKTDEFLSIDRTYLIIYLRGISYGPEYEVEVRCAECDKNFNHTINLSNLLIKPCPPDFTSPLTDTMPKCGIKVNWRLMRGKEESMVTDHRERFIKQYGDSSADDSLLYRMALMIEDIEGIKEKTEIMILLKKLPIQDIAYLRGLALDPPFGVDTKVPIACPFCYSDFDVELPLESGFFFPRLKRRNQENPSNSGSI